MLGGLAAFERKLLGERADLLAVLAILLLQPGDRLVAIHDRIQLGLVFAGALQNLLNGRAILAFQLRDQVQPLLDIGQSLRIILNIALVTADRRRHILQLVDRLGQRIVVLLHALIQAYELIQATLSGAELIQCGRKLVTAGVGPLDRAIDQRTEFAQAFGVAEYLLFLLQLLYFAWP